MLAMVAASISAALLTHAQVPDRLPFQNHVVGSDGIPLGTGPLGESEPRNYDVVFRIHPRSTGANILWAEEQTVTVDRGLMSVQLGEGLTFQEEPRPPLKELFKGLGADERYLSTTIRFSEQSAFFEILPRIRLLGNPGAILAHATRSISGADGRELLSLTADRAVINGDLKLTDTLTAPSISGNGAGLTGLNAAAFTTGKIQAQFIQGGLDASRIAGVVAPDRLPATIPASRIPSALNASIITSGIIDESRLPLSSLNTTRAATFKGLVSFGKGLSVKNDDLFLNHGALELGEPGNQDFGLQLRKIPLSTDTGQDVENVTTLWGNDGGTLGDKRHGNRSALTWNSENQVIIHRPLRVNSTLFTKVPSVRRGIFDSINTSIVNDMKNLNLSIEADGVILAESFYAFSDERIKMAVDSSSSLGNLRMVGALRVVDYQMKDRPQFGDAIRRGFIAQEVAESLPDAVSKSKEFLPDIFSPSHAVLRDPTNKTIAITTKTAHSLQQGVRVRLMLPDRTLETKVLAIDSDDTFSVADPGGAIDSIFVYGREAKDFHVLDSDQIFSATISAIQHLMGEAASLDKEITSIEGEIAALESIQSEVRQLTKQLNESNQAVPTRHVSVTTSAP